MITTFAYLRLLKCIAIRDCYEKVEELDHSDVIVDWASQEDSIYWRSLTFELCKTFTSFIISWFVLAFLNFIKLVRT